MADNDTKFEELNTLLDALVNGASTAMAIENIEAWYDENVAELGWNVNVYRIMAAFAEIQGDLARLDLLQKLKNLF